MDRTPDTAAFSPEVAELLERCARHCAESDRALAAWRVEQARISAFLDELGPILDQYRPVSEWGVLS